MPYSLAEVLRTADSLWPFDGAESWDASGLVAGDPAQTVSHVRLAVDAVAGTVEEALDAAADLLLVHHPLLLRGVTSVSEERYKGAMLARLIRGGCALVAAHTNADVVSGGVSDVLATRLGLQDLDPIQAGADPQTGIGRAGRLAEPTTLGRFARLVADVLPPTASGVRVAGDFEATVSRVAVCGGAGDSLLAAPAVLGADAFVTADLRHHPASEAREQAVLAGGPALIDVSHWASEWLWLDTAAAQLRESLPDLAVTVSDLRTDPWDFVVMA